MPKEVFGADVNQPLLAQAIRVYVTNKKQYTGSTKTRGEVVGSTAKIFRQKGTGRARHGSIMAPIFVGGGIVFGPKPRKVSLDLPKKMKHSALISALSARALEHKVLVVDGLDKLSGKTKEAVKLLSYVTDQKLKSALIVTNGKTDNVVKAVRNIPGISVLPSNLLNAYSVIRHEFLLVAKDAVEKIGIKEVNTDKIKKEVKTGVKPRSA